ncbi:hypothetical protein [Thermoleptolyngbya sp. M55_K2018_002]|uniref:hypothetical protein n=1 Tax=Thermoleptolyngbya sp. M55_K2018_002 TaxID=2747808 RepID=UPI0019F2C733|nr:hypothetical protein [Thermoleptolyngbya sp. M55_K2018_002]HIK41595.1 hypothetical protein [Thermoleptolyngbya sp. M55_K2018_002]
MLKSGATVSSESIKQEIEQLTTEELQQVADFIAFLRFRNKRRRMLDAEQLALLNTEFAEADRALAEAGMEDYASLLREEDQ